MLAVLLPAPLCAGPAAGGSEQERLQCLGRLRSDYGACVRQAQERCQTEFQSRLGGCLGGPECPDACLATERDCTKEPLFERDGCRLACQSDAKVAQQGCRLDADPEQCKRTARTKGVKCKQACTRSAQPRVQACRDASSECLRACAKQP